ncbi:lysozyme inhibitor LprI family protein [Nitrobacter sp.]|uniref:lysozyme inhibitor LprI family protein n=1 Tax=Nitrobacter sp. TaxID=29420 RepID=UPI0029CAAFB2|nr:lysozyme inhibitor LprI family protein [Nitrobacter sp.]
MRKCSLIGAMLLLGASTSANAETLYYGSRAGMEVTVVSKSDLGSVHAKIVTKHTRENAATFCRDYVGKVTAECIDEQLKVALEPTIQANCETGKFTVLTGEGYRFAGANPHFDPTSSSSPEYLILPLNEKEPLEDYSATGYRAALEQFKALCPTEVGASAAATQDQGLVPRGGEGPSFDCTKAKTAAARLICADGELARLDGELGAMFQRRKTQLVGSDQSQLVEAQRSWIRDRNLRCGLDGKSSAAIEVLARSKSCMGSAIRDRIAFLVRTESVTAQTGNIALATASGTGKSLEQPSQAACGKASTAQGAAMCQQSATTAAPSLVVRIESFLTDEPRPTVRGTTNLPDGTHLIVELRKAWLPDGGRRLAAGLAACGKDCSPLFVSGGGQFADALVTNGQFTAGPFADAGPSDPLPGRYILEVSAWSADQPAEVRALIGQRGEKLTGPLIEQCCLGPPESVIPSVKKFYHMLSIDHGVLIYHGKYVEIGRRDSGDQLPRQSDNRSGLIVPWRPGIESNCCTEQDRRNAVIAQQAQEHASERLLEYERIMHPIFRIVRLATIAGMCRLRSDDYARRFIWATNDAMDATTRRLHLSHDETHAAAVDNQKAEQEINDVLGWPDISTACQRLRDGAYLTDLDDVERKMTGNYH